MTKRMLVLTIGYDYYAAEPHDAAILIETFGRLIKVEAAGDWKDPHVPCAEQKLALTAVQFVDVADAPKATALIATGPAPTLPWEDWNANMQAAGGQGFAEHDLRKAWAAGKSVSEAFGDLTPF